ncbi:MAG: MurR/RpiR family transcriptional regulator [Microbacterium sp.]
MAYDDKTVLASARALIGSLPPSDRRVAEVILEHPEEVLHMTVAELAARAHSAESTAVRCCHKLGYRGFQDLKIRLARELAAVRPEVRPTLDATGGHHDVLRTVLAFEREVLDDINSTIADEAFDAATEALAASGRVLLVGFGVSYFVCLDAQDRLSSIGIDAQAPEAPNMKLLLSTRLRPGDVLLCISHTGATKEILRYAEVARGNGATTIAITSFARSRLARLADVLLVAGGRELDFRFDAVSGRLAHHAVLDALYLALAQALGERATRSLDVFHDEESAWRL